MALPASDNFTRANSTGLGANWTAQINNWDVSSNQAVPDNSGAFNMVFWAADTFANDHYAQVTVVTPSDGGPGVRVSGTSSRNGYYLEIFDTGDGQLTKFVANTQSTLATFGVTFNVSGKTGKISAVGTTITGYADGVSIVSATDSSLASGAGGLFSFAAGDVFDDFLADNVSAGGGGGQPTMSRFAGMEFGRDGVLFAPRAIGQSGVRMEQVRRVA